MRLLVIGDFHIPDRAKEIPIELRNKIQNLSFDLILCTGDLTSSEIYNYLKDIDSGVKGWRIALAGGEFLETCHVEILRAFQEAAAVYESLGAKVEVVEDLGWLYESAQLNGLLVQADGAAFHHERLERSPELFGPDVRQRLKKRFEAKS